MFAKPNIFCHFAQGIGDPKYFYVADVAQLNKLLVDVLDSYNEVNAVMNLVSGARAVGTGTGPTGQRLAPLSPRQRPMAQEPAAPGATESASPRVSSRFPPTYL